MDLLLHRHKPFILSSLQIAPETVQNCLSQASRGLIPRPGASNLLDPAQSRTWNSGRLHPRKSEPGKNIPEDADSESSFGRNLSKDALGRHKVLPMSGIVFEFA
jgi:hypothetical protein